MDHELRFKLNVLRGQIGVVNLLQESLDRHLSHFIIGTWNEFLFSATFISSPDLKTI